MPFIPSDQPDQSDQSTLSTPSIQSIQSITLKKALRLPSMLMICLLFAASAPAQERELTSDPRNHDLDNNDNFSPDGRFLCYDTRDMGGEGLGFSRTIEKINVETGEVTVLYAPEWIDAPAPGVAAASYHPVEDAVVFLHGPLAGEVSERGPYGKTNRTGALVPGDGSGRVRMTDFRDVATDRDTTPGAHRGGTHRHEFTRMGNRIGCTYDDLLMPQYDRTLAWLEPRPDAPGGVSHWFAVLVAVAPGDTAQPGDLAKAYADSWVDPRRTMRAFIGKVREEDGAFQESLFVVDIPEGTDITSADPGGPDRFPAPPAGVRVRRITREWAGGIVRGSPDGTRIAYYGMDEKGKTQVFVVPSDGSDRHEDPSKHPRQLTRFYNGAQPGVRWHPLGKTVVVPSSGGLTTVCAEEGPLFGRPVNLTPQVDGPARIAPVWSPDGMTVAYNRRTRLRDNGGNLLVDATGEPFSQILLVPFPDADRDGIADPLQEHPGRRGSVEDQEERAEHDPQKGDDAVEDTGHDVPYSPDGTEQVIPGAGPRAFHGVSLLCW